MELLNVIRRMSLRLKLPIREIARRTGVSRNTVKRHLKADTIEPKFAIPDRPSKLDPFAEKLAGWLKSEAGKSRKQRRTLKQLHAELVAMGFTWSYGRVAAFIVQSKPGALRNDALFAELPKGFRRLRDQMLRRPGGAREMVDILALVLQHDDRRS
jgi:hypothetical protein